MTGTSICIFGSTARGDCDVLSDRDVLIVGREDLLAEAAVPWRQAAWNVTAYSPEAFARLAEVKSLFIQHIKQDGRIVRDDFGFLDREIRSFSPKSSYAGERNDALRFLEWLPKEGGDYWGDLCIADMGYVFFRNAAVLHLATKGKYIFGFADLVSEFCSDLRLGADFVRDLSRLRALKHAYRGRRMGMKIGNSIQSLRDVADVFQSENNISECSSISDGITSDVYFQSRLSEWELVKAYDPLSLDSVTEDHPLFAVWKRLTAGGGYPRPRVLN